MTDTRTEHDLLGPVDVPRLALHGAHTQRALQNFQISGRQVAPSLVRAYGAVKLACCRSNCELGFLAADKAAALEQACTEMINGDLDAAVVTDALQGGAGTSTNMNVNEVLANRALMLLGAAPGNYAMLDPLADVNRHQSTNDTYPTALKIAAIHGLRGLEQSVVRLQEEFQGKEKSFAHIVKVGRTQMQEAVLTTLGREMSAYAEAFSRDRWRIYKCEERLRVVNLGGTAIGTGLGAPRQFIFRTIEHLRAITGLGLARAENMIDATQNADTLVEVSGILKALATSLIKVANDIRLLSAGTISGGGELRIPQCQAGSSIMPGKVNPVIPEAVIQAAIASIAQDQALTTAVAMGSLELNPFMPLIADALLTSISLLNQACRTFAQRCVAGLEADEVACRRLVENSTATATALVAKLGYQQVEELVLAARQTGKTVREMALDKRLLTPDEYAQLTAPEAVTRLGS